MLTVLWELLENSPHYFFQCLERFEMSEMLEELQNFLCFLIMEACEEESGGFLMICMTTLTIMSFEDDLHCLRPSNFYPPDGFYPSGSYDSFWTRHEDLFFSKFRFRLAHFHRMTRAMELEGKYFQCGEGRNKFRADLCLLVVLRRLSFPCRFWEMTADFGLTSNRLCEIFHTTLDIIFDRYHAIIEFETWLPFFAKFAEIFQEYGAPYYDLAGLIDGNFLRFCRPGGLGNKRSQLDQGQFYTGEKCAHGIKHMAAFFPNCMTALAGPFLGSVADGRMIAESRWIQLI